MTSINAITQETIQSQIYTIRGKQVMMDRDLARMYSVETKVLNQAVKRNLDRFPEKYMFQLTESEQEFLRSQFVTLKSEGNLKSQFVTSSWGGSRKLPLVFTEFGIVMLSSVLRSSSAINISIQITDAFVEMRKFLRNNAEVFVRLENMERRQSMFQYDTEKKFEQVFNALESGDLKPKQGIFYDGQETIQNQIYTIRGKRVMMDRDLEVSSCS